MHFLLGKLGVGLTLRMLQGCIAKVKKLPKLSPEAKADIEAFEGKLAATALERREQQATAEAALKQAAGSEEMNISDGKELTVPVSPPPPPAAPAPALPTSCKTRQCHHQAVFQH